MTAPMWVIRVLDDMYKRKEFEYGYVRWRRMPKLEFVQGVTEKLVIGIKDDCYWKSGLARRST